MVRKTLKENKETFIPDGEIEKRNRRDAQYDFLWDSSDEDMEDRSKRSYAESGAAGSQDRVAVWGLDPVLQGYSLKI